MKLQTKVKIKEPQNKISHAKSSLLFVGSCFSENIGNLLKNYKFKTLINPCGIAYNPVSVANSLALATGDKKIDKDNDLVFYDEKWHSLHHHGRFSHKEKEILLSTIKKELEQARNELAKLSHIFITLGTAWVFEHKKTKQIVNNCHKLTAELFGRKRLSLDETISALLSVIELIRKQNPNIEIIFTLSPIRHLKDGLHENQLSKATLLLAIESLKKKYNNISYFPAYEIALDELRDYRFFAEDMCHLNALGIGYISELFLEHYITQESKKQFPHLEKLQKALAHKVENPNSNSFQNFKAKTLEQIKILENTLPMIDLTKEKEQFT